MVNRIDGKPVERISQVPKRPSVPPREEKKALTPMLQQTLNKNLLHTAKRKQWGRMKSLITRGAKAEEKTTAGFSAITYAAAEGQTELVKKMVDGGIAVTLKDFAIRIAFIEAHTRGHKETAGFLLKAGKLGDGNSVIPLPPLTREQEERVAEAIERIVWRG